MTDIAPTPHEGSTASAVEAPTEAATKKSVPAKVLAFLGSFGLTFVLLIFLTILTWVGTLYQTERGIFEAQVKYFNSLFAVHRFEWLGINWGIPLPGGYLLMAVLTVNLIAGGVVRVLAAFVRNVNQGRLSLSRILSVPFLVIAHLGILFLLVAGFVKFEYSRDGHMRIWPDETKSEFESYYLWEIEISEPLAGGKYRQYLIPHEEFADLSLDEQRNYQAEALPFDLTFLGFSENAWPVAAGQATHGAGVGREVDGWRLQYRPSRKEKESNIAGAYAVLTEKASRRQHEVILWGLRYDRTRGLFEEPYPAVVEIDGKKWGIRLRHKRWSLPFAIRLEKFTRVLHPGTTRPKKFESDVFLIDEGEERALKIEMNEPLRHEGHILFQSSWGPQDPRWRGELYSDFSVVDNPADQWPLWSCVVIGFGLFWFLVIRLVGYILSERKRTSRRSVA